MTTRRLLWAAYAVLLAGAPPATAQTPEADFARLAERVRVGQGVTVIDTAGTTTRGRVVAIGPGELAVSSRSRTITFPATRVAEVRRQDSIVNGALIGGGALGAFGFMAAVSFSGETRIGDGFAGLLMFGAMGAGMGACLDALISGDTLLYRAPLSRTAHHRPLPPAVPLLVLKF